MGEGQGGSPSFGWHGPTLVWQADTRSMNPTVDAQLIADTYGEDEAASAAEYGAEFRRDIESFVSREGVEAVLVAGRRELPPAPGVCPDRWPRGW